MQTQRRFTASLAVAIAVLLLGVGAFAFVRAGIYNVAADDPHYPATHALLEQVREASIQARARRLEVPKDLMSEARIIQGAGNYNAMCTQCHLAPGMSSTELSRGLYPAPPNLTQETVEAGEAFWVVKHGIKASGMPAWGGSMDDEYIWNMAAFIQRLPKLDAASYQALVAKSEGHSHGGGETTPHDHGDMAGGGSADSGHAHAPGTPAHHDAPPDAPAGHAHAPVTPPHDDAPAHVDPPGTPPHTHAPEPSGDHPH
jgi:mono/diheme cytochrome c family protein